jgi:transcriptional regulator with XRE-family HTH domain
MPSVSVGRVLKGLREERGLSQRELAAKAKVTGAYVAMLETEKKKNPSLTILRRLAKALDVPATELLE